MSIFTVTSRLKKEVIADVDLSLYNLCKNHGCKPLVKRCFWGKNNSELVAYCPQDETQEVEKVFEGSHWKWNKFNPIEKK